jgi:hypothetical protein
VTDDDAHERRNTVIAQLKAGALDAAAKAPRPKNPRIFVMAELIRFLADDYRTGRKQLDPRARAIADRIRMYADRINRSRHNP